MEINGKILTLLSNGGTSAAGKEWQLQTAIIETTAAYPKKVAVEIFGGQRIADFALQQGELVTFSFDLESRESGGRWFTSARAWKVERANGLQTPPAGMPIANATLPNVPTAPAASAATPAAAAPSAPAAPSFRAAAVPPTAAGNRAATIPPTSTDLPF